MLVAITKIVSITNGVDDFCKVFFFFYLCFSLFCIKDRIETGRESVRILDVKISKLNAN